MIVGVPAQDPVGTLSGFLQDISVLVDVCQGKLGETALADAEEVAGPPGPEILFGNVKAVGALLQYGQPFGLFFAAVEEYTVGLFLTAAYAASQLVELGEAEALGILDQNDRGVGNIDADFDDGR